MTFGTGTEATEEDVARMADVDPPNRGGCHPRWPWCAGGVGVGFFYTPRLHERNT